MRHACFLSLVLLLAGCSTAPYTPAPPVVLPSTSGIEKSAARIKAGNAAISDSSRRLSGELADTRAKLDAAILSARQGSIDRAALDKNLADASASLDAALSENKTLTSRVADQDAVIDDQQNQIGVFKSAQADAQLKVNNQTRELTKDRQELAELRQFKEEMESRWGIGAILWGIGRLGWHILIVLAILAAAGFLLNMFVPALQPIFAAVVKFFVAIPGRMLAFLKNLWPKKPPP